MGHETLTTRPTDRIKWYAFAVTTNDTDSTTKVDAGELTKDGLIYDVLVQADEVIAADAGNALDVYIGDSNIILDGTTGGDLAANEFQGGTVTQRVVDVSSEGTIKVCSVDNVEDKFRDKTFNIYVAVYEGLI